MSASPSATEPLVRSGVPRSRWLSDGIIAGFVAIGASTAALFVAYVIANGAGTSQGNLVQGWLYQLTHNDVVAFSRATPAIAIALHILVGLFWALLYARFIESAPGLRWWLGRGPGWWKGMRFAILPWIFSLVVLLPAAAVNLLSWALSAGPLVPIGNLILHLIYGFTLGLLYDTSADAPAIGEDTIYAEPLEPAAIQHSEDVGAAGIVVGGIIGAVVGIALGAILPPVLPNVDLSGWSVALAIGGALAGGSVGGIVGSFAGLPSAGLDPAEVAEGPDPFHHFVFPFLIPPFLVVIIAGLIVTMGSILLQFGKSDIEVGGVAITKAVIAALVGILVIGLGGLFLSLQGGTQSSPSSRETVSHSSEH